MRERRANAGSEISSLADMQRSVLKLPFVEKSEQQIGQQKVGNRRQQQILQKDKKGIG